MRIAFTVLAAGLVLSGCFLRQASSPPDPAAPGQPASAARPAGADQKLIVRPAEGLNGKVSSVNASLRFVVLTFPVGQMAALNQRLNVYRGGLKVGELNVTGPQRDESVVADIITGETEVGDEVRDK